MAAAAAPLKVAGTEGTARTEVTAAACTGGGHDEPHPCSRQNKKST